MGIMHELARPKGRGTIYIGGGVTAGTLFTRKMDKDKTKNREEKKENCKREGVKFEMEGGV